MTERALDFHLEQFLPYLVHRVGSRLADGFQDRFTAAGVSLPEWRVISVLFEYGDQSMGDIARRTSINASTLTRLIGAMEKRELVKRERARSNQRLVFVRLRPTGFDIAAQLIPDIIDYEQDLSSCFTEAELRTFKSLLSKLFQSVTAEDGDDYSENQLVG